jgi:hypothetical protein
VRGISKWSTLAGVVALAALTGLGFNAKPAMAGDGDQQDEYGNRGYSDQYSPQETEDRGQGYYDQNSRNDRRNRARSNQGGRCDDRGYRNSCDGYRNQSGQWSQDGGWNNRHGGRQYQSGRSYRGHHSRRAHGQWSGNTGWGDQGNGRNRGGCGN